MTTHPCFSLFCSSGGFARRNTDQSTHLLTLLLDVLSLPTCGQIAELGIYPAVDPLDSTSRLMDPEYVSLEHYKACRDTQKLLQDYKSLQDIIAILGTRLLSLMRRAVAICRSRPMSPSSGLVLSLG